jgi:ribonuclease HII
MTPDPTCTPILTLGLDEAGRGACIGPLVLAACALSAEAATQLLAEGLGDSKGFGSPRTGQPRRAALAARIRSLAAWSAVRIVPAAEVDARARQGHLNVLEREVARELAAAVPFPVHRIVLDGEKLFAGLARQLRSACALNHADASEPAVAAASILAKTERDRSYAELCAPLEPDLGPIRGEGYPNPATARFLTAHLERFGTLPPGTRRSWRWPPLMAHTTAADRGDDPELF